MKYADSIRRIAADLFARGYRVQFVDGWETRGHGDFASMESLVCHHTATSRNAAGDYPSLHVVRDGRPGLAGPLCNFGLSRSGVIIVVASGVAYHAGVTKDPAHQSNSHSFGVEAENDGVGEAWPAAQLDAYAALGAAWCREFQRPVSRVQGHKEVASPAGRKSDPSFSMPEFRASVSAHLAGVVTASVPAPAPVAVPVSVPAAPTQVKPHLLAVDGDPGPATKMALQRAVGAVPDGSLGKQSWSLIQGRVGAKRDGVPGKQTWTLIQRHVGCALVDGREGPDTWRHIQAALNAGRF